jgi:hypothetical protein
MPWMQLATVHNDGQPLTLADIAQWIADLSAAGVPATAVPAGAAYWEPDSGSVAARPLNLLVCYVSPDEAAAMLVVAERDDQNATLEV